MAAQKQVRRAADELHVSKTPIVKYRPYNDRDMDDNIIREDQSDIRFEELYNEYIDSFRQAYKTYINNLQDKVISYDNLPYFDGRNMRFIEGKFTFSDMEHCFGIPSKKDEKTKELLKKLVNKMNDSNKNMKIDFSFDLSDNERYFLFEVDEAIEDYVSSTSSKGFQVVIENIYERLNKLQEKYKDNIEVQRELMYQSSNIHKMLTKNTEIRYINKDEEKKYFDSTFIDESCRLIIKQLSKKSQNLEVLNLKKMDKGTNKLVRVIRRNLSSFEVNPDKNTLVTYLGTNEKKIKNQVIEKLADKYLNDVIKDERVLEHASKYMIDDPITGQKILDAEFIKNNIINDNATVLKDYDLDKLYDLIKEVKETKTKEDIIDNINNLSGVWSEINRRKELGNTEEIEMTEDLIDLKYHEMLSNKAYQVEFAKKSINKEIRDKLGIEINAAIANTNLGVKAIRNYEILNSLFNDENNDYIKELNEELNDASYNNLEQKLTDLELKTRRTYFEMEAKHKGFDAVYRDFDMVDLTYLLSENQGVKSELKRIYNAGEESINYKKIAEKSEVISDLSDVSNYQPIIRRVREKVTDTNNNIFFPEDNYLVSGYPRTDRFDKNNIYVMEIPISKDASNLVYFPYDNTSKTFKPSNVLANINLVNDSNNNKLVVAEVNEPRKFLATINNSPDSKNVIESSVQYNLSLAKSEQDNYYDNLKKEHKNRFNNMSSVDNIKEKSDLHDIVFKYIDLGEDSKYLVTREIKDKVYKVLEAPESLKKNNDLNMMFRPITENDLNNNINNQK